jgi:hypothetical protein
MDNKRYAPTGPSNEPTCAIGLGSSASQCNSIWDASFCVPSSFRAQLSSSAIAIRIYKLMKYHCNGNVLPPSRLTCKWIWLREPSPNDSMDSSLNTDVCHPGTQKFCN